MYTKFQIVLPSKFDEIWDGLLGTVDIQGLYLVSFQK